jgi:hypothetical protein
MGDVADLEACEARCTANASGCHCFDFKAGPDTATGGTKGNCRLHADAGDITASGAGYSAYFRNGSAAAASVRAQADEARERLLAHATSSQARFSDDSTALGLADDGGGCMVCTQEYPCLFDLLSDQEERHNLASSNPDLVAKILAKQATFTAYFGKTMDPEKLANYDCPADVRPWYGNFSGALAATAPPLPAAATDLRPPPHRTASVPAAPGSLAHWLTLSAHTVVRARGGGGICRPLLPAQVVNAARECIEEGDCKLASSSCTPYQRFLRCLLMKP